MRPRACEGSARRKRSSNRGCDCSRFGSPPPLLVALLSPLAASAFDAVALGRPRDTRAAECNDRRQMASAAAGVTARERSSNRSRMWELSPPPSLPFAARSVCIRGRRKWRSTRAAECDDLSQIASAEAGVTARERSSNRDWRVQVGIPLLVAPARRLPPGSTVGYLFLVAMLT